MPGFDKTGPEGKGPTGGGRGGCRRDERSADNQGQGGKGLGRCRAQGEGGRGKGRGRRSMAEGKTRKENDQEKA